MACKPTPIESQVRLVHDSATLRSLIAPFEDSLCVASTESAPITWMNGFDVFQDLSRSVELDTLVTQCSPNGTPTSTTGYLAVVDLSTPLALVRVRYSGSI